MTISNEKQQPYNNETSNETKELKNNNFTTIIQQSFNNKKTNETHE
jgi:hypothetical protein